MMRGMSIRSLDIERRRSFSAALSGDPGAYLLTGSFTGGGTRRFPLNPVRVRAAVSGAALWTLGSSLVDLALRGLAPEEPERPGLTAEADMSSSKGRAEVLSKDTARRLKTSPLARERVSLVTKGVVCRASLARRGELKCANGKSRSEVLVASVAG